MKPAVLFALAVSLTACATFSAADEAALLAVDAAACASLSLIPVVGEVAALACPAEEAGLKALLEADVAAHPPTSTLPVPLSAAAKTKRALVTRPTLGGPVPMGYVPLARAARCQAAANASGS